MLNDAYKVKDMQLLLELNDSARHSLIIILDQFNGSSHGTIDRSGMTTAEKQKLKRGIAELKEKGLLTKADDSQRQFIINSNIIEANDIKTRKDHYLNSGLYKLDRTDLLAILIAIEHFFDDFYNKPYVIKFKVYNNKLRIPAKVFFNMVQFTEDIHNLEHRHLTGSILSTLINIADFIKCYCDKRQNYINISEDALNNVLLTFRGAMTSVDSFYPIYLAAEGKALRKFVQRWFFDNYPELLL